MYEVSYYTRRATLHEHRIPDLTIAIQDQNTDAMAMVVPN